MKVIFLDIDGVVNCWDIKERASGAAKMAIDILAKKEDNPYGDML